MRPLTEDETKMVFEKLYKFIGKSIQARTWVILAAF